MPHMGYAHGRTASGYPLPVPGGVDPMLTQAPPVPAGAYPPLGTVDDPAAAAAAGLQLLSAAAGGKVDMMRRQSLESQKGGWPGVVEEDSNGGASTGDVSPKPGKGKETAKTSKKRKADADEAGGDSKAAKLNGSVKKTSRSRKKSGEASKKESKAEAKADVKVAGSVDGKGIADQEAEGRRSSDAGDELKGRSASVSSDDEGYDDEMRDRREGRAGSRAKSVGDDDPDEKRKSFLERNRQGRQCGLDTG